VSDAGSDAGPAASLDAEDLARANHYGLISRLFYTPAEPNLLAEIGRLASGIDETESAGGLVIAWRDVQDACRGAFPVLVRQEYDRLFVGVGKAEVTPYLSTYAEPGAPDRYLVRLRDRLSELGLGRRKGVFEVEDHVSGISDVMRWLIEGGQPVAVQQLFFREFAHPGGMGFFAAVRKAASAHFYKAIASWAEAFYEVERAAFEMSSGR